MIHLIAVSISVYKACAQSSELSLDLPFHIMLQIHVAASYSHWLQQKFHIQYILFIGKKIHNWRVKRDLLYSPFSNW